MTIAVCILNYNGAAFLAKYIPFLLKTTYTNVQFFIIDNNSTDNSKAVAQTFEPAIIWLPLNQNYGYAGGYNQGLKTINAHVYVLLNSDVEVTPNWLQPIANLFKTNSKIAAIQPKILQIANRNYFEYAGAAGGYLDTFGYPFCRGRIFNNCEKDTGQYNTATPIMWASGACLAIRASAFNAVQGFDARFFAHMEEVDLCWRMQRAGYLIYAEPTAEVYHVGGGTLPTGSYKKAYLNFRNNHYMLLKNAPIFKLMWLLPLRFALDALAAYHALFFKKDIVFFKAIFMAHLAVLGFVFSKKNTVKLPRQMPKNGFYKSSIVYSFFIKKINTFYKLNMP